jgi:hypothetical protein
MKSETEYLNPARQTEAERLAAAHQNNKALADTPYEQRTYEMCLAAVRRDYVALEHIPLQISDRGIIHGDGTALRL